MPSMQRENTTIGHLGNKNKIPLFIIQSTLKCVSFEFLDRGCAVEVNQCLDTCRLLFSIL